MESQKLNVLLRGEAFEVLISEEAPQASRVFEVTGIWMPKGCLIY
jgi:hypothetical protein